MTFPLFEVSIPHITYALLGGFVVLFGMFSLFIREKLYIGEACVAFLFGIVIGPYGANIFNPRGWGGGTEEIADDITLEFTRVVLAIGVFAIGVELPKAYMWKHLKSLCFLLVPVMTWGWFISAALIYALIPKLNFLSSLVIAACLTPTDPILAAAVVGGKYADKHVPAHLRHLLAAESGCNDGAAFPFLYISLYLIIDRSTNKAVKDWFLLLWLFQIILGIVMGAVIGLAFRYLMKFCERKNLIDRQSYVAQYISLALLTIGICSILGTDDLLAAFSCGTAFAWDGFFNRQTEEAVFSSVIDLLFNIAAFVYVGAWMPFGKFSDAELTISVWRLIVIAILVLLLRRLPVMIALYKWIPDVKTFREALFSGHFGPMGIGAVFISTLAAQKLDTPQHPPANQEQLVAASIQPIVAFMVLTSIAVHGLSIPFFSLGRRVHSVSRTWSRQPDLGPDWANQAKHVNRAEDIVINRDSDMEKGQAGITDGEDGSSPEKLTIDVEQQHEDRIRRHSSSGIEAESATVGDRTEEGVEEGEARHVPFKAPDDGTEQKEENPPDGDEIEQEWQEGADKIIERRRGPAEEVEVKVIKNAFAHDKRTEDPRVFTGDIHEVRERVGGYLDKIRGVSREVESAGKRAEVGLEHMVSPHSGTDSSSEAHSFRRRAKGKDKQKATASGDEGGAMESDVEEEDGWQSEAGDESTTEHNRASSTSPRGHSKSHHKAKVPKVIRSVPLPGGGLHAPRGRRRNSMRRGLFGQVRHAISNNDKAAPSAAAVSEGSEGDDEAETRGRRGGPTPTEPILIHRPSDGSIRQVPTPLMTRADSLRVMSRTRESSPARSVRFAEHHRSASGASTPRGLGPGATDSSGRG